MHALITIHHLSCFPSKPHLTSESHGSEASAIHARCEHMREFLACFACRGQQQPFPIWYHNRYSTLPSSRPGLGACGVRCATFVHIQRLSHTVMRTCTLYGLVCPHTHLLEKKKNTSGKKEEGWGSFRSGNLCFFVILALKIEGFGRY